MNNLKYDWDDITIVPAAISEINSRSEITILNNNELPLMVAPMDMVIDEKNAHLFTNLNIPICLPRNIRDYDKFPEAFFSYGLDELSDIVNAKGILPKKVLIDVANGNMKKSIDLAKKIKAEYDLELMVGNIANPETYKLYCEAGIDYARCSVGTGSACTTSANIGIHYPLASLVRECYYEKSLLDVSGKFTSKIVADGGFRKYSDIIKALALGADYVMIGSIFNKALESCSDNFIKTGDEYTLFPGGKSADYFYSQRGKLYKHYRGMSTKEVQKSWNRTTLKTAEGISMFNEVEYTLSGWVENFEDYLRSAMSYCNCISLADFIGQVQTVHITQNAFNRFNK